MWGGLVASPAAHRADRRHGDPSHPSDPIRARSPDHVKRANYRTTECGPVGARHPQPGHLRGTHLGDHLPDTTADGRIRCGVTGAKAAHYQILYLQTPVTDLSWHQDHDHFFLTEYNPTHLNYWIPLVKPSRTEAGLRVMPWDRLRGKSPRVFNLCRRSGASRLYSLRDGAPCTCPTGAGSTITTGAISTFRYVPRLAQ